MSRSQPTDRTPNPATRFYEWSGGEGIIRYYSKEESKNIDVGDKFSFILLDSLATIKGWNDASDSGIFSNEVKDTRAEPLLVKSFKGGVIAEGFYSQIRDRVKAAGGHFTTNLYIAYKDGNELKLGSLQFKGAALNSWVDFQKENRQAVYDKAVAISGSTEGKKGRVTYQTPNFKLVDISPEMNAKALVLDKELQAYLKGYFQRTKVDQVASHDNLPGEQDYSQERPPLDQRQEPEEDLKDVFPDDSDVPF